MLPWEERDKSGCRGARPTKDWIIVELDLGLQILRRDGEDPEENLSDEFEIGWTVGRADFKQDMLQVAEAISS